MAGKARLFDGEELVILAIWASLIQAACGGPHAALATAKRIARMRCATAYAAVGGITETPPATAAVAVPLAAIRRRLVGNLQQEN